MRKYFLRSIFCTALLLGGLANSPDAEATEPKMEMGSIGQMMMMGLGPLPGASIMSPVEMDEIGEIITEYAWPMPEERSWPVDITGEPVVETRQKDELWHTVEGWYSLARIRTMYRRTTAQLRELNPDLDLSDLEDGQEILVWKRDEDGISESRGEPQAGRLIYGEPMPESEHYVVQYPHRAFGTYYAVSEVVRILDDYYDQFPEADPLVVGDFSFRTGRTISPHKSHQGGRDVDISLPRKDPPPNYDRFHYLRRDNLDAERALWMLTNILEGGYVEYVFLDRHHQRTLRNLAEEQGAPEEWLDTVFQYPSHSGPGIVRHASGHARHFHIRFRCQETDRWCS